MVDKMTPEQALDIIDALGYKGPKAADAFEVIGRRLEQADIIEVERDYWRDHRTEAEHLRLEQVKADLVFARVRLSRDAENIRELRDNLEKANTTLDIEREKYLHMRELFWEVTKQLNTARESLSEVMEDCAGIDI